MSGSLARCEAQEVNTIGWLRTYGRRYPGPDLRKPVRAEQKRLAMRLYASAMDRRVREAACEAAASMPEARDIPEWATPGESQDEIREPRQAESGSPKEGSGSILAPLRGARSQDAETG